jgi:DNA-binding Lrp family transcriptional regulator
LLQRSQELQTRILKELTSPGTFQWNFRESYANIAKRLHADEETVRLALHRAVESGAVRGWRLVINPNLFQMNVAGLQLEVAEGLQNKKGDVILPTLTLVDGVFLILDFYGKGLRLAMYYYNDRDLSRKIELISRICDCEGQVIHWKVSMPRPKVKLRYADWQILGLIRKDPRRDAKDIATCLGGFSTRTINRRLKTMTASDIAYLIPLRDARRARGLMCCFLIRCLEERKRSLQEAISNRTFLRIDFGYTSLRSQVLLTLFAENLGEAEDLLGWLKSLEGVTSVSMNLLKDFIFVDDWLDGKISSILEARGKISAAAGGP